MENAKKIEIVLNEDVETDYRDLVTTWALVKLKFINADELEKICDKILYKKINTKDDQIRKQYSLFFIGGDGWRAAEMPEEVAGSLKSKKDVDGYVDHLINLLKEGVVANEDAIKSSGFSQITPENLEQAEKNIKENLTLGKVMDKIEKDLNGNTETTENVDGNENVANEKVNPESVLEACGIAVDDDDEGIDWMAVGKIVAAGAAVLLVSYAAYNFLQPTEKVIIIDSSSLQSL